MIIIGKEKTVSFKVSLSIYSLASYTLAIFDVDTNETFFVA